MTPRRPGLSVALPIIEAAADEDRDELVDLWARLMANAMDPKLGSVRYEFIGAAKRLNPMNARLLVSVHERRVTVIQRANPANEGPGISLEALCALLDRSRDEVELMLKCTGAIGFFDLRGSSQDCVVTAFNREFMRACYPEAGLGHGCVGQRRAEASGSGGLCKVEGTALRYSGSKLK